MKNKIVSKLLKTSHLLVYLIASKISNFTFLEPEKSKKSKTAILELELKKI